MKSKTTQISMENDARNVLTALEETKTQMEALTEQKAFLFPLGRINALTQNLRHVIDRRDFKGMQDLISEIDTFMADTGTAIKSQMLDLIPETKNN